MRRFIAGGLPVGLLLCAMLAGCNGYECWLCPSQKPAIMSEMPPEQVTAAPPAEFAVPPPPEPVAPPPPPEPVAPAPAPAPPVPAAVAAAIEDLGQKYPGLFTFDRSRGMFRFNSDITFDSGSSVVKPRAKDALSKLAEILNGDLAKDRAMTIVGYTDSDRVAKAATIAHLKDLGKPATNQGLSEARAESVAAVLKAGGIDSGRMTTRGMGQADPVASNSTAAGKAQNRRVEIYLTPMKSN